MSKYDYIKRLLKPLTEAKSMLHAYKVGVDCAKNGANSKNCQFSIFSSKEKMEAWAQGLKDGKNPPSKG